MMCEETKAGNEKCLKHNQFALRLRDFLSARNPPDTVTIVSKLLHLLHANRGDPQSAELHGVARLQLRPTKSLKVSSDDESADDALASEEEEDIATYLGDGVRSA
jgi:hypothetical protein